MSLTSITNAVKEATLENCDCLQSPTDRETIPYPSLIFLICIIEMMVKGSLRKVRKPPTSSRISWQYLGGSDHNQKAMLSAMRAKKLDLIKRR